MVRLSTSTTVMMLLILSIIVIGSTSFVLIGLQGPRNAIGPSSASLFSLAERKGQSSKVQRADALKEELKVLCKNTKNGTSAPKSVREKIKAVAQELDELNPTKNPAKSRLLQGKWRLLYSTVPGPSSGRLGPLVADVYQQIDIDASRIYNILELGPDWALRGALEADSEIISSNTWRINFDFVYNKFAGNEIQRKKFENIERRLWRMTYLDDSFRILYGSQESGTDEFIFIMERA